MTRAALGLGGLACLSVTVSLLVLLALEPSDRRLALVASALVGLLWVEGLMIWTLRPPWFAGWLP